MTVDANTKNIWRSEADIPSISGAGEPFIESLVAELERREWDVPDVFAIRLAIEEGIANAIEHGNCKDQTKKAHLKAELDDNRVLITIRDEGPGFPFKDVPDPSLEENLEKPCGRGLFLIRNFMTNVWHNDQGNVIYMEKQYHQGAEESGAEES